MPCRGPACTNYPSQRRRFRIDDANPNQGISAALGAENRPASWVPDAPQIKGYWPGYAWLTRLDKVFEVNLVPGTFFDAAVVHLLSTATVASLRLATPKSRLEVAWFRPNIVVETADESTGLVENDRVGKAVAIGEEVRRRITGLCPRCIMTTMAQRDLPKNPNVFRTTVQPNSGNAGVLASVLHSGRIQRGDAVVAT